MPIPPKVLQLIQKTSAELHSSTDPTEMVNGLQNGEGWAQHALLADYTHHVERILTRILGNHTDLDDLVQEVFIRSFERIRELRVPGALGGWLTSIAVYVAREAIRRKRRRRWLSFVPPEETIETEMPTASPEVRAAVMAVYEVIGHLNPDEQIAFTLRFIEEMELSEIAAVCGVSLSTVKRRIKRAETRFEERGTAHEMLAPWFKEGTRWR